MLIAKVYANGYQTTCTWGRAESTATINRRAEGS
jgi:hypothetical protein